MNMNEPRYNGDPFAFIDFMNNYETSSDALGWSDTVKIQRLPLYIDNLAIIAYKQIMKLKFQNWNDFKKVYSSKLMIKGVERFIRRDFYEMVQGTNETVIEFSINLYAFAGKAFGENSQKTEPIKRILEDQFMSGVHPYIRVMLNLIDYIDYDDLVKKAMKIEINMKENMKPFKPRDIKKRYKDIKIYKLNNEEVENYFEPFNDDNDHLFELCNEEHQSIILENPQMSTRYIEAISNNNIIDNIVKEDMHDFVTSEDLGMINKSLDCGGDANYMEVESLEQIPYQEICSKSCFTENSKVNFGKIVEFEFDDVFSIDEIEKVTYYKVDSYIFERDFELKFARVCREHCSITEDIEYTKNEELCYLNSEEVVLDKVVDVCEIESCIDFEEIVTVEFVRVLHPIQMVTHERVLDNESKNNIDVLEPICENIMKIKKIEDGEPNNEFKEVHINLLREYLKILLLWLRIITINKDRNCKSIIVQTMNYQIMVFRFMHNEVTKFTSFIKLMLSTRILINCGNKIGPEGILWLNDRRI